MRLILYRYEDGHFSFVNYQEFLVPRDFLLVHSDFKPVNLPSHLEPEKFPFPVECCCFSILLAIGFAINFVSDWLSDSY